MHLKRYTHSRRRAAINAVRGMGDVSVSSGEDGYLDDEESSDFEGEEDSQEMV